MVPFKILIAEDDSVLRDLYLRKFKGEKYVVQTAENGQETIAMIEKDPPDLLLLDINMPVVDGFGVLAKFPPNQRKFRVIILSNYDDDASRKMGQDAKIDDYFVKKDMTIKSLVEMVDRLLEVKFSA